MKSRLAKLFPLSFRIRVVRPRIRRIKQAALTLVAWYLYRLTYYRLGVMDALDRLLKRRPPLVPPRRYIYLIGGNFQEVGERFVQSLIKHVNLLPTDHVLDVGSGAGRVAVPLTRYLTQQGRYEGFDAWAAGVHWCQREISPRFPHFHFQVANVHNGLYSTRARQSAAEYRFPFPDASFDVVFLSSVMTHLLPDDMTNYLNETARVLRPGGRCFITWFLLTPEVLVRVEAKQTKPEFLLDFGRYRAENAELREGAIAYDQAHIRSLYRSANLELLAPVEAGAWSGAPNPVNFQDVIVARKQSLGVSNAKPRAA